jgi:hypothetical protein
MSWEVSSNADKNIKYGSFVPTDTSIQAKGDAYFKAIGQKHVRRTLYGEPFDE